MKKDNKQKVHVLILSKTFPTTHQRKGEPTLFGERFANAMCDINQYCAPCAMYENCPRNPWLPKKDCTSWKKIHTIRNNYPYWEKRIKEVLEDKARLSIRQWTGQPFRSEQEEIAMLGPADEIGIQKIRYQADYITGEYGFFVEGKEVSLTELAKNDGLSMEDFANWFKDSDLSEPLAIIHFTKFRY